MQKMAEEIARVSPEAAIFCPQAPEILERDTDQHDTPQFIETPQELKQGDILYDRAVMRQWFAIDGTLPMLQPRLEKAAQAMNHFIDLLLESYGLADGDTVLMGFSQGAVLALYAAMAREKEMAGVVVHSTILFGRSARFKTIPKVLYIYGTEDAEFSQKMFHDSFQQLQDYAGPKCMEKKVPGLGHFTNAKSRALCAGFIKGWLA